LAIAFPICKIGANNANTSHLSISGAVGIKAEEYPRQAFLKWRADKVACRDHSEDYRYSCRGLARRRMREHRSRARAAAQCRASCDRIADAYRPVVRSRAVAVAFAHADPNADANAFGGPVAYSGSVAQSCSDAGEDNASASATARFVLSAHQWGEVLRARRVLPQLRSRRDRPGRRRREDPVRGQQRLAVGTDLTPAPAFTPWAMAVVRLADRSDARW
jgi:hypothetical protein